MGNLGIWECGMRNAEFKEKMKKDRGIALGVKIVLVLFPRTRISIMRESMFSNLARTETYKETMA